MSFTRGAAVVLTHAYGAAVAEADVWQLIRRESLQPRTVTILADYASIGYRYVQLDPNGGEDGREEPPLAVPAAQSRHSLRPSGGTAAAPAVPAPPQHYTIRTEPFVPMQPDQLATLGVGHPAGVTGRRLGFLRPRAAPRTALSPSFATNADDCEFRGLAAALAAVRDHQPRDGRRVQKLRRARRRVLRQATDSPEILIAARSANLILYEGHLAYQDLIDHPVLKRSQAEDYPLDEGDLEGSGGRNAPSSRARIPGRPRGS